MLVSSWGSLSSFFPIAGLIAGIIAIAVGIIIIVWPKIIAYVIGIYLIIVGVLAIIAAFR